MTTRSIVRFWLPLAATWLMMAVEGPLLAAVIARLGEARVNLAAYGVAYAFALVAESPVIMLMSASTALAKDGLSYRRLRSFSLWLNLLVTTVLALCLIPVFYNGFVLNLLGLPEEVARLTHRSLLLLLPWPACIGIRRFYQGVLIRNHQTRRVAAATILRVTAMATVALLFYRFGTLAGAHVGALALSAGVLAEVLATRLLAGPAIARTLLLAGNGGGDMHYRGLFRYYLPLALTPFIALCVHPMVTFFLGRGRFPLESLAVMPVIYGLTFVFRALGLSYQEVAIALVGERMEHYRPIRNFALGLGGAVAVFLGAIAYTPLSMAWFHSLSGLSVELSDFAARPLQILAFLPPLTVLISFQRAILVKQGVTTPISVATALEALGIFALLLLLGVYSPLSGATAAALSYIFGRLLAVSALGWPVSRLLRASDFKTSTGQT